MDFLLEDGRLKENFVMVLGNVERCFTSVTNSKGKAQMGVSADSSEIYMPQRPRTGNSRSCP